MKKFQIIGLALGIVCAFCAFTIPSAFAVSKLLANGAEIASMLEISILGALVLSSNGIGSPAILCEGIFDALVEIGGVLSEVNEVLMDNGELLAATASDLEASREGDDVECTPLKACENNPTLVVALNLPWHVEIELEGTNFFLDFLPATTKHPGYNIECRVFGITAKVFCDGLVRALLLLDASGDANAEFNEATAGKTECSDGSEGTVVSDEGLEFPLVDADGALLTLSE